MSPVIRVDSEVWAWLKQLARPLEDTPNTVLRRVAGLDKQPSGSSDRAGPRRPAGSKVSSPRRPKERTNSGRALNELWKVGARHALYHKDGSYYNHLRQFPGALFDANGYVCFKSEGEYVKAPQLQHGAQLHVAGGIASMPAYVKKS